MFSDIYYEIARVFRADATRETDAGEALRLSELGDLAEERARALRAEEYAQILDIPEAF
jgi:hypothetical protein